MLIFKAFVIKNIDELGGICIFFTRNVVLKFA